MLVLDVQRMVYNEHILLTDCTLPSHICSLYIQRASLYNQVQRLNYYMY